MLPQRPMLEFKEIVKVRSIKINTVLC